MPKISGVCGGESLVGDGNEVAHVDLLLGPRGSAVETAYCIGLTNNKDGFTTLLALVAPNLMCKPPTRPSRRRCLAGQGVNQHEQPRCPRLPSARSWHCRTDRRCSQKPSCQRCVAAVIRSIGNGNTMVELRSLAMSNNVAR